MNSSRTVAANDRLPWLSDDVPAPIRPARSAGQPGMLPLVIILSIAVVALIAYHMGTSPAAGPAFSPPGLDAGPVETVPLPEAREVVAPSPSEPAAPPPAIAPPAITPTVEVAPAVSSPPKVKKTPRAAPTRDVRRGRISTRARAPGKAPASRTKARKSETKEAELTYWPAYTSAGAAGRMVRIGTFADRRQAKEAWFEIVNMYPGMEGLNSVVVPVASKRNGRTYYRLQMGTTSQAHSEVLCQWMRVIRVSCVVVGVEKAA